jgi:threonine/homoserine/homoserine lactone efflux protein
VLRALVAFAPVAALLTITPGAATALVVRSAAVGGRRQALATTIGNSLAVLAWGCFAAMGIAAVVATSAEAFTAVKLVGAVVLVVLGLQSLRGARDAQGALWYSALAYLVARARRAFVEGPWLARAQRLTGAVLVGLGGRLAFERR